MSRSLNTPSTRILASLGAGLVLGVALAAFAPVAVPATVGVAQPIGTAWLNGLQMTVIPLVFSLLVTGIAATAEAARSGALAARAIAVILAIMVASAVAAAILTPLLLDVAPMPAASAAALRGALADVAPAGAVPPLGEFMAGMVPSNVVAAAANGAFLSLILFALVFAFALTRIDRSGRDLLTTFFSAIRDTMLVVIGWVIWVAPVGVFALALTVAAKTGTAAVGALLHYIVTVSSVGVVVSLFALPLAVWPRRAQHPVGARRGRVGARGRKPGQGDGGARERRRPQTRRAHRARTEGQGRWYRAGCGGGGPGGGRGGGCGQCADESGIPPGRGGCCGHKGRRGIGQRRGARRTGAGGVEEGRALGWQSGARRCAMQMTAVLTSAEIGGYVAYNPETGTASQGETFEHAIANLREAVELYLEEFPMKIERAAIVTHFDVPVHA